jgi:hypothetical protein
VFWPAIESQSLINEDSDIDNALLYTEPVPWAKVPKSIYYCEIAYLDPYHISDTPPDRETNKKCSIMMFSNSKDFVQLIEHVCELYAEVESLNYSLSNAPFYHCGRPGS